MLLLKWACLTLPVVTMPLLGKASGRGGAQLAQRLLPCRCAAGTPAQQARPLLLLRSVTCAEHPRSPCRPLQRLLQTAQVGAERVLGTILGGLLGLVADGLATNWWTLVR